jgi:hypothetical protein
MEPRHPPVPYRKEVIVGAEKEADRLGEAIAARVEEIALNGKALRVRKWGLHESCQLTGTLGEIVRVFISSIDGKFSWMAFLQRDVSALLSEYEGSIHRILSETLLAENFQTLEEAKEWTAELGLDEIVRLMDIIVRQNIRPFAKAVAELLVEVGRRINAASKDPEV